MEVILIMFVGVLLGATVFPPALKKANEKLTLASTGLLIFSMGALLGGRESFLEELGQVGLASLVFCLAPVVLSTAVVYLLTRAFLADITERHAADSRARAQADPSSSSGEAIMIGISVGALSLGIAYGLSGFSVAVLDALTEHSDLILYALMFFVGISVGGSRGLIGKIREYRLRVFIIPIGVIVGSVAAGVVCGPLLGMSWAMGGAIASGLGWYSLAGVMMSGIAGANIGSITFLSSLLRELVSFFAIPWIARHLNYPTCIAPAGATSEDTTLPMMIRCTNGETVVLSVFNGVLCSAAVPLLIELFHSFM